MTALADGTGFPFQMFWVIPAFIAVAVLIGLLGRQARKRQSRRIARFAQARGLRYALRDDAWVNTWLAIRRGRGSSHRALNVVTGRLRGREVAVFNHLFKIGSGDDKSTKYAVVTAVRLPRELPELRVSRADGRIERVGAIELESEEFNRQYAVHGDRRLASDVLHPRLMQWLLDRQAPGFVINGPYIAHVRWGLIETDRIEADVDYVAQIVDSIPRFVLRDARS